MNITETKISNLNNDPPNFKKKLYPVPNDPNVQKCYHITCAVGQRGSGKTYSIVKMLANAEKLGYKDPINGDKVDMRHILFSPTIKGNPVFTSLKYLHEDDMINEYTEEKLYDILEEIELDNLETERYKKYRIAYEKYTKMTDKEIEKCKDTEMLSLLMSYDFINWKELTPPKYINGCVVNIILDDCLANKSAFSAKKGSLLVKTILNSRHHGVNVIIAAQNLKSVNKAIRNNVDVWILFKFKSEKIVLDDLYPEVSGMVSPEEFLSLYHYATTNPNDALIIDDKAERGDKFKLNFDVILKWK
jgi:hypothetical protein